MSEADRYQWELTGNVPEPKSDTPSSADSASAPPVEQAASTDATQQAASEPATPKPKANAETRIKQLLGDVRAERDRAEALAARLADLESRQSKPDVAASSPAPDALRDFDAYSEANPGASYEAFLLAKFEHVQHQKAEQAQQEIARRERDSVRQTRVDAYRQRIANLDLEGLHPDVAGLVPMDQLLEGVTPTVLNVAAQEILESEHAATLLTHFSEHPEELRALAQQTPVAAIRTLAKLESRLAAPVTPPPKTVSSAPPPPTTLGSRPAMPADPARAAVATRDFATYEREMNAREVARAR